MSGQLEIGRARRASRRRALLLTTALSGLVPLFPQTAGALNVVVTNTNDSGAGSLRAAITTINGSADPANNITFGNGFQGQITLQSNLPTITKPVNIDFAGDPGIFGGNFLAGNFGLGAAAAGAVVTINNSHTYTGNTTLTAGTLQVGVPIDGSRQFSDSKSLLVMSAGTVFDIPAGASSTFQNFSGNGSITNNGSGNGLTLAGGNTANRTFAGTISGTGNLTMFGGGEKLTLSGSTTYSGATFIAADLDISGGTSFTVELAAGAANAFSPNSAFSMIGGATLRLNGFNQTIGSLDVNTISGALGLVDLGSATLTTGGNNTSTEMFGSMIGTGGLTKTGTGTMIMSSSKTGQFGDVFNAQIDYSGATLVAGGTLQSGNVNAFSPNSAHTVAAGATLDLNNFNNIIGSLAGPGNVTLGSAILTAGGDNSSTTFSGVMSGTGGLTKVGTGTFMLTGDNTFTGLTTISAGTLQLGNGGTTGAVAGNIVDNATLAVNHSNNLTLAGVISGTGALQQNGTGTTILTGANTYTGGTAISAGTLQIGAGGTTGSITGNVVNNTNLAFNRSDGATFGGTISGPGAVQQIGVGSTTFTADNSYTGGTTISSGALVLGNGGTTGAITGNVTNNGLLAVNHSNALTLAGVISGTGSFQQFGSGTTTFTGNNTYSGGTQIGLGTLQIGAGGTTGTITGNVTNNANLAFNRSDTVVFGGTISGTGAVQQNGAGATVFTANNTYTGGTTIAAGALQLGLGGTSGSIVGNVTKQWPLHCQPFGCVHVRRCYFRYRKLHAIRQRNDDPNRRQHLYRLHNDSWWDAATRQWRHRGIDRRQRRR